MKELSRSAREKYSQTASSPVDALATLAMLGLNTDILDAEPTDTVFRRFKFDYDLPELQVGLSPDRLESVADGHLEGWVLYDQRRGHLFEFVFVETGHRQTEAGLDLVNFAKNEMILLGCSDLQEAPITEEMAVDLRAALVLK